MLAGVLVAMEAKYHVKCLVGLYSRARPFKQQDSKPTDDTSVDIEELTFAEPATLILSDLVRYCTSKLQGIAAECGKVNATSLKERVLAAFPNLTAHAEGREI